MAKRSRASNCGLSPWPVEAWPPSDRRLWDAAVQPGRLMQQPGRAAGWRPATLTNRVTAYGFWLAWLDRTGGLDAHPDPKERVSETALLAYTEWLDARLGPTTTAMRIHHLVGALQAMMPEEDWLWLSLAAQRLASWAAEQRDKAHPGIAIDDALTAGLDACDDAESDPRQGVSAAIRFRNGLLLALFSLRPLRRRTMGLIRIGRELIEQSGRLRLVFTRHDTKEKQPLSVAVPDIIVPYLKRWISYWRPILLGERSDTGALWIDRDGCPLSPSAISMAIGRLTEDPLGEHVSPHMLRTILSTDLIESAPEAAHAATMLLNHADARTTETHYVRTSQERGGRIVNDLIEGIRTAHEQELAPPRKRA